jgi:hypothetical protein
MYQVIVTDDFINLMKELPIKYLAILTKSFLSVNKVEENIPVENIEFIVDLLEQIKNQEIE